MNGDDMSGFLFGPKKRANRQYVPLNNKYSFTTNMKNKVCLVSFVACFFALVINAKSQSLQELIGDQYKLVNHFQEAVNSGDYSKAYDMLGSDYKSSVHMSVFAEIAREKKWQIKE